MFNYSRWWAPHSFDLIVVHLGRDLVPRVRSCPRRVVAREAGRFRWGFAWWTLVDAMLFDAEGKKKKT